MRDANSRSKVATLGVVLGTVSLLFALAHCSSDTADSAVVPGGDGGPGAFCSPGDPTCACDQEGDTIDCGRIEHQEGSYVTCSMGRTTCTNGKWTLCSGDRIVTKSVDVNLNAAGLHTLQHPVTCTNLCDPNDCQSTGSDLPTDVDASNVAVSDAGVSLILDGGDAGPGCAGLQCAVASCGGVPSSTTISGYVYDPAGVNPLSGVTVYVPVDATGLLPTMTAGASTATCGGAGVITAVTSAVSGADGSFTLTGVPSGTGIPAGNGIPIVFQTGKWRRELMLDSVTSCTGNTLGALTCKSPTAAADCKFRLPKNQADGWNWTNGTYSKADMPKLAIVSGGADPFECLLLKVGIDVNEFGSKSNAAQAGRAVHFYESPDRTATIFGSRDKGQALYNATPATLATYDALLLPCEGSDYDKLGTRGSNSTQSTITPASPINPYANMITYMAGGGRAFATHYSYVWLEFPSKYTYVPGPNDWSQVTGWQHGFSVPDDPLTATVNQTFAQGSTMNAWLQNLGAASGGNVSLHQARHDLNDTLGNFTQDWLNADDNNASPTTAFSPLISFETPYPLVTPAPPTYGRVVFSDFHVSSSAITPAATCQTNTDCGFGQTCSGGSPGGFPGSCSESCYNTGDCGSTAYSCSAGGGSCKRDGCRRNSDCASNNCSGSGGHGGRCQCTSNAQCGSGVCSGGMCNAKTCSDDTQCGSIEHCSGVSAGVCSKGCTTNADCIAGGELCMNNGTTTTTAAYTQPAVGVNVTISMSNTSTFSVNQIVHVKSGGTYKIVSKTATSVTATRQAAGDSGTGSIASGKSVNADCNGGACSCKGCFTASQCKSNNDAPSCSGAATTPGTCSPAMPAAPGSPSSFTSSSSSTGPWGWFPYACQQSPMTAQEKALEYMFFNLTSCVQPSSPPPPPPTYTAATFTQDFTASCRPDQNVVWREFDWQANVPATSSIVFKAQSGPDIAGLLPATPITIATTTTSTPTLPGFDVAIIDTSNGNTTAGTGPFNIATPPVRSQAVLRVTITMAPTSDALGSPLLKNWKVVYDCAAAE